MIKIKTHPVFCVGFSFGFLRDRFSGHGCGVLIRGCVRLTTRHGLHSIVAITPLTLEAGFLEPALDAGFLVVEAGFAEARDEGFVVLETGFSDAALEAGLVALGSGWAAALEAGLDSGLA